MQLQILPSVNTGRCLMFNLKKLFTVLPCIHRLQRLFFKLEENVSIQKTKVVRNVKLKARPFCHNTGRILATTNAATRTNCFLKNQKK